jgi:oxygen-independent coproporphyrinogen III oxidase
MGLYFHIPFCPYICPYCDFIKTNHNHPKTTKQYFLQLEDSVRQWATTFPLWDVFTTVSVYFGGGTPGLFPASFYKPIIDLVSQYTTIVEMTLETNPAMNTPHQLEAYAKLGIHRVTLGVQSMDNAYLGVLGRSYTADTVVSNIKTLGQFGITNIQADLLYGIGATPLSLPKRQVAQELQCLIDAGVTGISPYCLTWEAESVWGQTSKQSTQDLFCETTAQTEYVAVCDTLEKSGMTFWELSNWGYSMPKHNTLYWTGQPFMGFGLGAHSLEPVETKPPWGPRYKRVKRSQLHAYSPSNYSFTTDLYKPDTVLPMTDKQDIHWWDITQWTEITVATLLRTRWGIPKHKFAINAKIHQGIDKKHIVETELTYVLTHAGMWYADAWAVDFIDCLNH